MKLAEQLTVDPLSSEPIYVQIYRALMLLVDADSLRGDMPPPVLLARELRVAPASIRHAYKELVYAGIFVCRDCRYSVVEISA